MDKKLTDIYHGVIMDHNNHPVHFEKAEDHDHELNAYNPLCGDHFHVFLNIENEVVTNARFHGYGCAISKASTSILVQEITGKAVTELPGIIQEFKEVFDDYGESTPATEDVNFLAFQPVNQFPSRVKCATLSWDELNNFLKESYKS